MSDQVSQPMTPSETAALQTGVAKMPKKDQRFGDMPQWSVNQACWLRVRAGRAIPLQEVDEQRGRNG